MNHVRLKNVCATNLSEFWGTDYSENVYLWNGTLHNSTLEEIEQKQKEILADEFANPEKMSIAFEECQRLYSKYSEVIGEKLNIIHDINVPVSFWRTAMGYWFFRHIHIVYEKYSTLSKLSIDETSIKLLSQDSFFIPYDSEDYFNCFCSDFGVQQLVSQYYYLFKRTEFLALEMIFPLSNDKRKNIQERRKKLPSIRRLLVKWSLRLLGCWKNAEILLLEVNISKIMVSILFKSKLGIRPFMLPKLKVSNDHFDQNKRELLLDVQTDSEFDLYLVNTLYYCMPKLLIEDFAWIYPAFDKDIKSRSFSTIVSEGWISNLRSSLYVAIAQNNNRLFVCQEHAAFGPLFSKNYSWYDLTVADYFISTGWGDSKETKILQGGAAFRKVRQYKPDKSKHKILFICHARYQYIMEFGVNNEFNSNFVKSIAVVDSFVTSLPIKMRDYFYLRPRQVNQYFWDSQRTLNLLNRDIKVDKESFKVSIHSAKIVIIDHISSGVAELLLSGIPFIIIHDNSIVPISSDYQHLIEDLFKAGVVHPSSNSAITHLEQVYDDVMDWWESELVINSINNFKNAFLSDPKQTEEVLMAFLKHE